MTPYEAAQKYGADSSPHNVNRKDTALMARQQVIDKIAND